ncbi:MAG: hypothetical protein ACFFB4_11860 [Promethearchaeota archaeon]
MADYKEIIGWFFGAAIAVVWIAFGILGAGNMLFLAVAISLTILFGVLSGGFIALSKGKNNYKEVIGWLFGAAIAVVWILFALIAPGDLVFLVVAISLTILFGVLAGGLIKLGTKS